MEKRTPLYDEHLAAGARMMPFAGYEMPVRYDGDAAEHKRVREQAGLFDVSHMGEFLLRGPQALPLIQHVTSNDASKLVPGKAQYSCLTRPTGGVIDDLIVYRIEDELYMMVVNASNLQKDWDWISEQNQAFGAQLEDISEQTALLALSGPLALEVLQKLASVPLDDLGFYAFRKGKLGELDNVLFATTGYTGERTFEIFVRSEEAVRAWRMILEAGQEAGVAPAGLGARDTLRLEMGYMLYGNDLNDETTPLEAGLGWITKLKKEHFNGIEVLREQKANGPARRLVGFRMEDRGIPRQHYPIVHQGETVGEVTSGTFSPMLKQGIGLGYVPAALSELDTGLEIMIRDKPHPARVVKPPFVGDTSLTTWLKKK